MSSMYTNTYGFGATQLTVGVGVAYQVRPGEKVNGGFIKYLSGGSLSIVSNVGAGGASGALGYVLGTTEVVSWEGPATLFLSASGSTAVCGYVPSYSQGYSLFP
jgi:hypothetical protein